MAFKWEVYEGSTDQTSLEEGGEVDLTGISVDIVSTWNIEPSDDTAQLETFESGVVELLDRSVKNVDKTSLDKRPVVSFHNLDKNLSKFIILSVVILLGLGFLLVVISDVIRGSLSFEKYMTAVMSFLSGMGVMVLKKGGSSNRK